MVYSEKKILRFIEENPDEMIKVLSSLIKELINNAENIVLKWRKENQHPSEADNISKCNLQILISQMHSLITLSEGFYLFSSKTKLYDINSAVSVLRGIYERAFIFNNIYIMTSNDIERDILLNIWEINGLNNRVHLKSVPEIYIQQQEKEKSYIETLRQQTEYLIEKLDINESAKNDIRKNLKDSAQLKGFEFIKENHIVTQFKTINLIASPKYLFGDNQLDYLYKYLSFTSHPTFLSTLQFGQRFENRHDIKEMVNILCIAFRIFSIAVKDFCHSTSNAKKFWEGSIPYTSFNYTEIITI